MNHVHYVLQYRHNQQKQDTVYLRKIYLIFSHETMVFS